MLDMVCCVNEACGFSLDECTRDDRWYEIGELQLMIIRINVTDISATRAAILDEVAVVSQAEAAP